jgi:hypothetical protein
VTGLQIDPSTGQVHEHPSTGQVQDRSCRPVPPPRCPPPGCPPPRLRFLPRVPVEVLVTVPLSTVLGQGDEPGLLPGHGPITADQVRAMVHDLKTKAVWRCAAVEDTHNTLLALGTATYTLKYTPGARLKRLTNQLYQNRCAFPSCTTQATHCDWDHATPHPTGATCACNGIPLCRRCHRLKTTGLIDVRITTPARATPDQPTGTLIWTTTTGHRYLQRPRPLTPRTPTQLVHAANATTNPDPPPY